MSLPNWPIKLGMELLIDSRFKPMSDFNPKPILISAIGIYGPTSGGVAISRLPGDDLKLSNFNATWSRVGLSVCY